MYECVFTMYIHVFTLFITRELNFLFVNNRALFCKIKIMIHVDVNLVPIHLRQKSIK